MDCIYTLTEDDLTEDSKEFDDVNAAINADANDITYTFDEPRDITSVELKAPEDITVEIIVTNNDGDETVTVMNLFILLSGNISVL